MAEQNRVRPHRIAPSDRGREAPNRTMNALDVIHQSEAVVARPTEEMLRTISFLDDLSDELDGVAERFALPGPLRMTLHLVRGHLEGKTVTPGLIEVSSSLGLVEVSLEDDTHDQNQGGTASIRAGSS